MKTILLLILIANVLSIESCSLSKVHNNEKYVTIECPKNQDSLYSRKQILMQFAELLNASAPEFKSYESTGFYVEQEKPRFFFVYDLTDTLNNTISLNSCINFINNHVYHFSPYLYQFSFSNIAVLENGKMNLFKSINCKDKDDNIEGVIRYLNQEMKNYSNNEELLNRVRNYRKYGRYIRIDNYSDFVCP